MFAQPTGLMKVLLLLFVLLPAISLSQQTPDGNIKVGEKRDPLFLDNGVVKIGIDREFGAAITHLSWSTYRKNVVNIHDPGRLIQQSYYAGRRLDRTEEGQSPAWSPWPWNPIQGGGVKSWAKVPKFEIDDEGRLFSETIPKLWDMADEDADAIMRQWTTFEPGLPNVVVVSCELVCQREGNDRWGKKGKRHQEIPALYFTRNFSVFRNYLGEGKWREEAQLPGPPWGKTHAPRNVMACFNRQGQGVAVFSPAATEHWNFGPHGGGNSPEATDGPCVHLSPIVLLDLHPRSTLRYRYWMVVGTEEEIVSSIDQLLGKYQAERVRLVNP